MRLRPLMWFALVPVISLAAESCGGDEGAGQGEPCDPSVQTGCATGLVCEQVQGGSPTCFAPVSFKGRVYDSLKNTGIPNAHLVARDANNAAVSRVAISQGDGTYALVVPATRDSSGKPLKAEYTIRADAMGYQTFPTPPRVALPIDVTTATGDPPTVQTAATDVAMIAIQNPGSVGSVSGTVGGEHPGGTLVVAGGATGIADLDGTYTVFNVKAGSGVAVNGYQSGVNYTPASANVTAGQETPGVNLNPAGTATAKVSGKIEIVNPGAGNETSVILVVDDPATFNANAASGEAPKGLRVGGITGDFTLTGVPLGKYVVLAAFENDFLVRDPDTSIAGTSIVHITVTGDYAIPDAFKVTGALDVVSPGATKMDTVTDAQPTFTWKDDSGEDHYEVRVFDAFGNKVWENLAVPGVSGGANATAKYAGPALTSGMIYQFRATSIKQGGTPLATTEDLKGVFLKK